MTDVQMPLVDQIRPEAPQTPACPANNTPRLLGPFPPRQQPSPPPPPMATPPITPAPSMRVHLEKVSRTNTRSPGHFPARDPLNKYTARPLPKVQDASLTSIFELIDLDCISEWETITGEKLLAIPFNNGGGTLDWQSVTAERILTAVAEITKVQEVDIAMPKANETAKKARCSPSTFLIHGLQKEQADTLLECRIWSLQAITFQATCFAPNCPDYLFTLKGFVTLTIRNIYPIVKQVWDSEEARNYIETLVNAITPTQRGEVEVEICSLLASMNILCLDTKEAGNTLTPQFNVYADSSKMSLNEVWTRLRTHYANRTFSSTMLGLGIVEQSPFSCTLCHGVDHPWGLCPFPDTPDWNGLRREATGDSNKCRNMRANGPHAMR